MAPDHLPPDFLAGSPPRPPVVAIGCPQGAGGLAGLGLAKDPSTPGVELLACATPRELVEALVSGRAAAGVRGRLPANEVKQALQRAFVLEPAAGLLRAVVVEIKGALRLVGPVGIDEGVTVEQRLVLAEAGTKLLASLAAAARAAGEPAPAEGWRPRLGVLSLGRPEDRARMARIAASLAAGEELTTALRERGLAAHHYDVQIERAAKACDVLVTPDGTHGNLIFRTLHYLGQVPAWGAPALGLWPQAVFVDSSRARRSFEGPVRLAAWLAVRRG